MADKNDSLVELKATLNTKEAIRAVNQLEKELKKRKISLPAVLDTSDSKKAAQKFATQIQKIFRKEGIDIDTSSILDSLKQVAKQAESTADTINKIQPSAHREQAAYEYPEKNKKSSQPVSAEKTSLGKKIAEQAGDTFSTLFSVSTGILTLVSEVKEAVSEIKTLDNVLTEIGKSSGMTKQQLKQLGMDAYDTASRYGRTARDYLTSVQEMSHSGFQGKKATAMAEQSLLAQSAGDMDAGLADRYILATNDAYNYSGNTEKINEVLDGQNSITNRNRVALEDMAAAMTEAGAVASEYRIKIEDLSAMIGTMEAVTQSGGSEVGSAINTILGNLQDDSSSKIADTLTAANVSMTEMADGTEKLRDPISILRDLSSAFQQLGEDDPLRADILTSIGGSSYADELSALLQNMELYDKMLVDYSQGNGSALADSSRSADTLNGSLITLSNTWTEFVNSIVNSDELKSGANVLDTLVDTAQKALDTFGLLPIVVSVAYTTMSAKSGGLIRLIPTINNSPFLATVEFSSDVYDSYVHI